VTVDALGIGRAWPSIDLPGYREHPAEFATYSTFAFDELPPIERQLDDGLSWLLSQPPVEYSLGGGHVYEGDPVRPATGTELDSLTSDVNMRLPPAFDAFVRTLEPRARVRSCTACYLDLGDFPVAVDTEGWLIHFLSDQQWVGHWLLYIGHDGSEAVVAGYPPYGFAQGADFERGTDEAVVCADSFSEFLYRFWIENEIWFALADEGARELTSEEKRYAEHYRRFST